MIRLATWNVHKCQGIDRKVSVRRIADVIAEYRPEAIGLQEIFAGQAEELGALLGMHLVPGSVRKLSGQSLRKRGFECVAACVREYI